MITSGRNIFTLIFCWKKLFCFAMITVYEQMVIQLWYKFLSEIIRGLAWDAGAIARQGGQQEPKGTEDHIKQIFIIPFPNHVLLILLGTGFALIRE